MQRQVSFDVTDYEWSTDLLEHSESMSGPSSPTHQNSEDGTEYVIITLDIQGDSVCLVSVEPVADGRMSVEGDAEPLQQNRNKTVLNRPQLLKFDASEALRGVNMFISMTDAGWFAVEMRFLKLTAKTNGLLLRSKFGECIGINSKEFALELFDTLTRRCNITREMINYQELLEFWCQICDQSFHFRLQLFFEMANGDRDGRLTEDELREFFRITATASNQPITQKLANEYAALIMEEFDPDDMGCIIMEDLELLLLDIETLSHLTSIVETKKPAKKWYNFVGKISNSSLITCLKNRASTKKT